MFWGREVKAPGPHFIGFFHKGIDLLITGRGRRLNREDHPRQFFPF
jgi:hypothetical protein